MAPGISWGSTRAAEPGGDILKKRVYAIVWLAK